MIRGDMVTASEQSPVIKCANPVRRSGGAFPGGATFKLTPEDSNQPAEGVKTPGQQGLGPGPSWSSPLHVTPVSSPAAHHTSTDPTLKPPGYRDSTGTPPGSSEFCGTRGEKPLSSKP